MTKSSITGININWPHDSVHGYLQQVMKEFHYLYSVCQHPPQETGVLKYMSEVFICRGGSGSGGGGIWNGYAKVLEYKVFTVAGSNGFNMPFNIVNNKVDVFVYGAGGSGSMNTYNNEYAGGGGGWMNRMYNISLIPGKIYNIFVGKGGQTTDEIYGSQGYTTGFSPGGSSFFDNFVSANGGSYGYGGVGGRGGSGGAGTFGGGDAYQFGGGGVLYNSDADNALRLIDNGLLKGGQGGVWGGGGGSRFSNGGDGGYYGGGGGTSRASNSDLVYLHSATGGNGGYYGGGGGSINNIALGGLYFDNGAWKQSGYGGNGGNMTIEGENGTNTIGYTNFKAFTDEGFDEVNVNMSGNAISTKCSDGNKAFSSGGGGYGGNGGSSNSNLISYQDSSSRGCGGGGGYGGNGAKGYDDYYMTPFPGGGGGGFGSNGDGHGGGGGYYADGYGGGGGYWHEGTLTSGGGGVLRIPNSNKYDTYIFGWGGQASNNSGGNGGDGIVVLRYYKWVDPRNPT